MIRNVLKKICTAFFISVVLFSAVPLYAQESLTLSVTPTLFQIAVEPGEVWKSSVKVVNSNPYDLTVYAEPVNFEAEGEAGHGRFMPLIHEEEKESTLAGWIDITSDPIVIPQEQSKEVEFTVTVPDNASPGGHFASIMVGTRPPEDSDSRLAVSTSQIISALFFMRVSGDVEEKGSIREFSTARTFYEKPEANFSLRFENSGNVHLQPQGDIAIFNMWGKERGFIPINQKSHFGNVLPNSIRKFDFSWSGEQSITDIGRYKAEVTLAYGDDNRAFANATAYFWVVPVRATIVTLLILSLFIFFVVWAVKRYVRRAVYLAGYEELQPIKREPVVAVKDEPRKVVKRKEITLSRTSERNDLSAPIRKGVIDLRSHINESEAYPSRLASLWSFVVDYRLFFVSVLVCIAAVVTGSFYLVDVLTKEKAYEVTIEKPDGEVVFSSEEVIKERLEDEQQIVQQGGAGSATDQKFILSLVNASGEPGSAARLALRLEELGYVVSDISSEIERIQKRTAIVYDQDVADSAIKMSEQLGNVPISAQTEQSTQTEGAPEILVVVGADQIE